MKGLNLEIKPCFYLNINLNSLFASIDKEDLVLICSMEQKCASRKDHV